MFKPKFIDKKMEDNFNVVIIGNYNKEDNIFSNSFPVTLENSRIKSKYINRFMLSLREKHSFPKDFLTTFHPEIIDKFLKIDILILTYNKTDKLSLEYLKTFYYLYYTKLDEEDIPKNIIIMERYYETSEDNNSKEIVDSNSVEEIKKLFNAYFCDYETDEEKLTQVLSKCLENLLKEYNYIDDYSSFKYKELNKEIDSYILIYGDKSSQNTFLNILLNSECHFQYKKIKENFYEIKYEMEINNNKLSFKIIIKLVNNEYFYDSECNILLYDINDNNSFNSIQKLIRSLISHNGPKFKKIFHLIALNSSLPHISENENKARIKEGKISAYEIGANFSVLNTNNNKNLNLEIKKRFNNVLVNIVDFINKSKNTIVKNDIIPKTTFTNEHIINTKKLSDFEEIDDDEIPSALSFIRDINNKMKNEFQDNKNYLFNICPLCLGQLNIRINDQSNIIIVYCNKCKTEPIGLNIEQFLEFNKKRNFNFHCPLCQNILCYDFKTKLLECGCNKQNRSSLKKKKTISKFDSIEINRIPVFLTDCYCSVHNDFHQSYLKYSKRGLCCKCSNEKKNNNYLVEDFDISNLIEKSNIQLGIEQNLIDTLQNKFNECINALKLKFENLINKKIQIHKIKSDLIKSLQIIQNNYTLISNIESLKYDYGEKFIFNENDSIENKLKNIFNYFNYEADINNLYFGKNNNLNSNIQISIPFDKKVKNQKNRMVTDIWGLKNNEFVCISFNDGKAEIFDTKDIKNNEYYKSYTIYAFSPNQGINSLFVSKNENSIWKQKNTNKNEIIYLNGYEEIKIIQMNNDYTSYEKLYTIKDEELWNVSNSIELHNNYILSLNILNEINLISFYFGENNEIKYKKKNVNSILSENGKSVLSISKITDNIISLYLNNELEEFFRRTTVTEAAKDDDEGDDDFIRNLTLRDSIPIKDDKQKYPTEEKEEENSEEFTKILTINYGKEDIFGTKEEMKEYKFNKNYKVIGCLSEKKPFLLLQYTEEKKDNKKNLFYIFDYNITQFINSFQYKKELDSPRLLKLLNFDKLVNNQGFIMMDKELNIYQYFFEEENENKVYIIKNKKQYKDKENQISCIVSLIKKKNYL